LSIPRADASIKERSPRGFGVINAHLNFGASVAGASVAGASVATGACACVAGASVAAGASGFVPQALNNIDASTKRLKAKNMLFFISFSPYE
jgi:hypothetical protein